MRSACALALAIVAAGGCREPAAGPAVALSTTDLVMRGGGIESAAIPGRAAYDRYGCAACHGPQGAGDGPLSMRMAVRPRDFGDAQAYRYGGSLEAVSRTIAEGGFPGTGMPAFPDIPPEDRAELAAFVVSRWSHAVPTKGVRE